MVGVFLANGFEEIEALTVVDLLRRAKCPVETVSIENTNVVIGAHNIKVVSDGNIGGFDFSNCSMIVLPGGMPGTTNLQKSLKLCQNVKIFAQEGKWIAAICAAPMILGEMGILEGKKATIYPGMENHLLGYIPNEDSVVVDDNIITAKGPGKAMEFALTIVQILTDSQKRSELGRSLVL